MGVIDDSRYKQSTISRVFSLGTLSAEPPAQTSNYNTFKARPDFSDIAGLSRHMIFLRLSFTFEAHDFLRQKWNFEDS